MVRMVVGAAACAMALAAWSAPVRADGGVSSLSDLDKGAQQWHYIAPNGSADKKPADALTGVEATHSATDAKPVTSRRVTQIDEHLSIEAPPPPPRKPVPSLWFSHDAGK